MWVHDGAAAASSSLGGGGDGGVINDETTPPFGFGHADVEEWAPSGTLQTGVAGAG
jgi:hypothetical protein